MFHDMAGNVGEEVEDRFLQKQVRERTEASVQLLLAITAGGTETHARGEGDYFLFISIGMKTKPCLTRRPSIMPERAQSCAALQGGCIWHTVARGFSVSDLAWLNTHLGTWAGQVESSRTSFCKIKQTVNGNAAHKLDKVRRWARRRTSSTFSPATNPLKDCMQEMRKTFSVYTSSTNEIYDTPSAKTTKKEQIKQR